MVEVLVIPDGAAEDPRRGPTSLERARTPVLDALCAQGDVRLRRTIPLGLPAGSEVGIPTLLEVELAAAPSRGLIEAAAHEIPVPRGQHAWRVDVPRERAGDRSLRAEATCMGLTHVRGHRFLFIGTKPPELPPPWRVWPGGVTLRRALDPSTVVVAGRGAASGVGRLLGARVVIPATATGDTDTDFTAKTRAAIGALDTAARVVVHIGAPDEASHRRDPRAKVAALEAIDALVLAPLADALNVRGDALVVCPDHGTDPSTGEHLADPVPMLRWSGGIAPSGPDRLTESAPVQAVSA